MYLVSYPVYFDAYGLLLATGFVAVELLATGFVADELLAREFMAPERLLFLF